MRRVDWAYFAGLFDGEGSVTISQCVRKSNTQSCNAGVTVTNSSLRIANNNPIPLLELEDVFGGRVREHKAGSDTWVWICQGFKATEFAQGILPYVRIKPGQLEIFIAFAELKRKKPMGAVPLSKAEIGARTKLIQELKTVRLFEGGKR